MEKALAGILALASLALLALAFVSPELSPWREAGVLTGFLVLAGLAWVVALVTATYRAIRHTARAGWIFMLIVFLWLPALPVILYSVSGLNITRFLHRNRTRPRLPVAA